MQLRMYYYCLGGDFIIKTEIIPEKAIIEKEVGILVNEADDLITNTIRKIKYETIIMYFNIGKIISKYKNKCDSKYGDAIINQFSEELTLKYGKGFNKSNIYYAVKFYELFSNFQMSGKSKIQKVQTSAKFNEKMVPLSKSYKQKILMSKLFINVTWSHIIEILTLDNIETMYYYICEINNKNLTIEEIRSAIKSKSYERTVVNQRKGVIKNEIEKSLKDPLFLNIKNKKRTERELEREIIKNISSFKKKLVIVLCFMSNNIKLMLIH